MKKQALFASIVLVVAVGSVMGQKIETQASNGAAITRVQTALNHLTMWRSTLRPDLPRAQSP